MRKKYKLKENYIVVILFMIFFLFQFIQIFQFKFFVQSDDFGYIANSALQLESIYWRYDTIL